MGLFESLYQSLAMYRSNNAMRINDRFYSYAELSDAVNRIRQAVCDKPEKVIGVIADDVLNTYASILALWFEGKAYVPISRDMPLERNINIIQQAGIQTIIYTGDVLTVDAESIDSSVLADVIKETVIHTGSTDDVAYLLFTSGTTGAPKGVPITVRNLTAFTEAFEKLQTPITAMSRCLQMFDLTFDLSVMSFLIPLLKGACVYTVPKHAIRYAYVHQLMEEQRLTFALMVPSVLHYLRKYFDEIHLPEMEHCLFCGEALSLDVLKEWSDCLPNAVMVNVYGPTEHTIFCTEYVYERRSINKVYKDVLSIGKPMSGTDVMIIDENCKDAPGNTAGELCLAGDQLTPGYWRDTEKTANAFFTKEHEGVVKRFYRTGDLCKMDDEGDILYIGRMDFQIKVNGFRVELSEIEFQAKKYLGKTNAVAVAYENENGSTAIGLAIESEIFNTEALKGQFIKTLPSYMIPNRIVFTNSFPLNVNGKTDRKELKKMFECNAS
jgi:D-alanine--poly(phosphoribitol) ligase subunit 1